MEEKLRNEFGSVYIRDQGRIYRILVGKIEVEFRPDSFREEGFEFFAVFESSRIVEIPVLYKFLDYKWKDVYEDCLEDGLGEVVVGTEENGLRFTIRTILHCFENDYFECIRDLVKIHSQVHEEVSNKMEPFKSISV